MDGPNCPKYISTKVYKDYYSCRLLSYCNKLQNKFQGGLVSRII